MSEDADLLNQMLRSPCVNVCVMDARTGFCQGCWRTIGEIRDWATSTRERRLEILHRLAERRGAETLTAPGRKLKSQKGTG